MRQLHRNGWRSIWPNFSHTFSYKCGVDPENLLVFGEAFFIIELILDVQRNDYTTGNPNRQTKNVDEREDLVLYKQPQSYDDIISKHAYFFRFGIGNWQFKRRLQNTKNYFLS